MFQDLGCPLRVASAASCLELQFCDCHGRCCLAAVRQSSNGGPGPENRYRGHRVTERTHHSGGPGSVHGNERGGGGREVDRRAFVLIDGGRARDRGSGATSGTARDHHAASDRHYAASDHRRAASAHRRAANAHRRAGSGRRGDVRTLHRRNPVGPQPRSSRPSRRPFQCPRSRR